MHIISIMLYPEMKKSNIKSPDVSEDVANIKNRGRKRASEIQERFEKIAVLKKRKCMNI